MKKMISMTLMIVGVFCFITGFILYSSPKKSAETVTKVSGSDNTVNAPTVFTDSSNSTAPSGAPERTFRANELEKIIDMAIVDGVLTPNERNLIKEFASSRGLNYNVIIRDVEKRIAESGGMAETEMVDANKKQGDDFEKFVVQKFDKKFYKIKEWAGDKYVSGTFAETTQHPDLLLELDLKKDTAELAVECKWRSSFYRGGIEFATPDQFKRYQHFEESKQTPVFIAIGVGGSGTKPEQLFVVPLRRLKTNFIYSNQLSKYEKRIDSDFFYDIQSQMLR